jgi:hypothetical protein
MDTDTDLVFKGKDLDLIQSLVYDSSLEPMYCSFRMYLHWPDELPSGITPEGYETLCDLWIARACLYHGITLDQSLDQAVFTRVWDRAIAQGLQWPGFQRLKLSNIDQSYFQKMLNQENPFD